MNLPAATEDPGKSRAAFIRALVAAGVTKARLIRKYCLEANFDEPTGQAIKSAKEYVPKGAVAPMRPTYRHLCRVALDAYLRAVDKGQPIVITAEIKQALVAIQHCLDTDTSIETRKVYRRKKARKKQRERKLKQQVTP